jgi:hypothetical protein
VISLLSLCLSLFFVFSFSVFVCLCKHTHTLSHTQTLSHHRFSFCNFLLCRNVSLSFEFFVALSIPFVLMFWIWINNNLDLENKIAGKLFCCILFIILHNVFCSFSMSHTHIYTHTLSHSRFSFIVFFIFYRFL